MSNSGSKRQSREVGRLVHLDFIDALVAENNESVRRLLDGGLPVNARHPQSGQTLLLLAAAVDAADIVSLLLDRGADLQAVDRTGAGPVTRAVRGVQPSVLEVLLRCGADPNQKDNLGSPPLYYAVWRTDDEPPEKLERMIKILLSHGADPDLSNDAGMTPRTQAEMFKHIHDFTHLLPPKE